MPSYDTVGFHAQQAAEKALKGLLVRYQVSFEKTHDLGALIALAEGAVPGLQEQLAGVADLTPYAVSARYPGEDPLPPLTHDGAAGLLAVAQRTVDQVRSLIQAFLAEADRDG